MTGATPIVELRAARIGRGATTIVDRVDLRIAGGDCVAVLGASGCGKSTLLDTVIGLTPPLEGGVRLFGHALAELEEAPRAGLLQRIGVVFQRDALFRGMTVADNLALAPRTTGGIPEPVLAELIALKLDQVGLTGLGARFPYELSGGQQKRVAFARAVMLDPELLVCDEPTAGLDPLNAARIGELMAKLRSEIAAAVLVVTHDVPLIRSLGGRVLVIGDGRVLAAGDVDTLRADANPDVAGFFRRGAAPAAIQEGA